MKPPLLVPLLVLAYVGGVARASRAQEETAVDGTRTLGVSAELSETLKLFRQPTEEDVAFLAGLSGLENDVRVLAATAEGLYRSRDYLEVLPPREERTLARFHQELELFLVDPEPYFVKKPRIARLWARIFFDTRLRIRAEVLDGWEYDARQVKRGLALLRANTDGWVRSSDEEGQEIAKRVDLAGALQRARLKDLGALREVPGTPSEVAEEDVDRLLEIFEKPPGPERSELLDTEILAVDRLARRMRGLLFSSRLKVDVEGWLRWRTELDAKAAQLRADVAIWQPQTDKGKDAPREIRAQKKTARRRRAQALAMEGLSYDPFDDELAYASAQMAEFVSGILTAIDYYDRFLALRGIRVYDDRNWPEELTERELHAIFQVQQYEKSLQGDLPPQVPPGQELGGTQPPGGSGD